MEVRRSVKDTSCIQRKFWDGLECCFYIDKCTFGIDKIFLNTLFKTINIMIVINNSYSKFIFKTQKQTFITAVPFKYCSTSILCLAERLIASGNALIRYSTSSGMRNQKVCVTARRVIEEGVTRLRTALSHL